MFRPFFADIISGYNLLYNMPNMSFNFPILFSQMYRVTDVAVFIPLGLNGRVYMRYGCVVKNVRVGIVMGPLFVYEFIVSLVYKYI
jgi:hypothetical protein